MAISLISQLIVKLLVTSLVSIHKYLNAELLRRMRRDVHKFYHKDFL
jgi:hypothetical protein